MKRKTENRLNRLRRQYIAYIEQYAPIYYKYMDEWNTLCLDKDRAYINLYAGKLSDALNASQKVLDRHPENREGLLLKALSLIRLGAQSLPEFVLPEDAACNQRWIVEGRANYEQRTLANPCYFTARRILDQYMELYPDKAAPALLLDGILEEQRRATDLVISGGTQERMAPRVPMKQSTYGASCGSSRSRRSRPAVEPMK